MAAPPMAEQAAVVETPSGKGSGDENFPVGSFLLPARLRPHVAVFYGYARAIDDIADNPDLAPEDKIARLEGFAEVLSGRSDAPGFEKAERLRISLKEMGVTPRHGCDLVSAFQQDAVKLRYESWDELIDYCDRSAAPVGRYLLDLHGESPAGYPESDALCNALQVINHLQDCQADYRALDRVYLPLDWMRAAGTEVAELDLPAASPGMRIVLDRCVAGVEGLLLVARGLPARLRSRRLALESSVILHIAERLTARLGREDPLAGRVALSRTEFLRCGLSGVRDALLRRG